MLSISPPGHANNSNVCHNHHTSSTSNTRSLGISSLPNESIYAGTDTSTDWVQLFTMILSHLPIITLAKVMSVSRHFQGAAEPALKSQLRVMAQRNDIKLMLICAPPDCVQSRIRCQFLQTPGLDTTDYDNAPRTTELHSIYRPEALSPETAPRGPAVGSIILLVGGDDMVCGGMNQAGSKGFATREVVLEDYESFIQLRVKLNLVITSKDFFIAPTFVVYDGVIRINRAWLERNSHEIVWMNSDKSVGLRMHAIEKQATEDEAKAFDLEIRGTLSHSYRKMISADSIRVTCSFDAATSQHSKSGGKS